MFCKKDVLRNFAKVTGKHLWQSLVFDEVANFLRTLFLQNTSGRLLLLLDEIQNTKKMKIRELKERKFEKKVREIG